MRSFDFSNSHYFLFLLVLFNINLAFKGQEQAKKKANKMAKNYHQINNPGHRVEVLARAIPGASMLQPSCVQAWGGR